MKTRDLLLFSYGAFDKKIEGRTKLQKYIYFLSEMLSEHHGFAPHFYGPYSAKVAEANSELKALGYLAEDRTVYGLDNNGFEMTKYKYSLTEDGEKLLARKKKELHDEWKIINKSAKIIKEAGDIDYMELALAAKAYFILSNEGGRANKEKIITLAKKNGWSITDQDLNRAVDFLSKMQLAQWSES